MSSLVGWTAKTPMEKKLVLGVLHRSGHKNFEEANDSQIANIAALRKGERKMSKMSIQSRKKSSASTTAPFMRKMSLAQSNGPSIIR